MQITGASRDTVLRIILVILIILTAVGIFIYKNSSLPEHEPVQSAQKLPTLLMLNTSGCPYCQIMIPILEELREEYKGQINIEIIDVDEHPEEAVKYSVISFPTLILLDSEGDQIGRHDGYISKENLVKALKKVGVI
ncbi:MAG: thioredoxin family protein [Thermacetogeniaceae bacterium]|jgi:thioredoxin 1|nr:thioredoxin family protein [Syntrophomonadaceae bacterium]